MPEGSHHHDQPSMLSDTHVAQILYDDLKPVVRSYVDNLSEQLVGLMRKYGKKNLIELKDIASSDEMSSEDAKRLGAISEAMKACFENHLPLEAKREAAMLRERASELYQGAKREHGPQDALFLALMREFEPQEFTRHVVEATSFPELCECVRALVRADELDEAWDLLQKISTHESAQDLDQADSDSVEFRFGVESVGYAAIEKKRLDIVLACCELGAQDGLFIRVTQAYVDNQQWNAIEPWMKIIKNSGRGNHLGIESFAIIIEGMLKAGKSTKEMENLLYRLYPNMTDEHRRTNPLSPAKFAEEGGFVVGKLAIALARSGSKQNALSLFKRISLSNMYDHTPEFVRAYSQSEEKYQVGLFTENIHPDEVTKTLAFAECALVMAEEGKDPTVARRIVESRLKELSDGMEKNFVLILLAAIHVMQMDWTRVDELLLQTESHKFYLGDEQQRKRLFGLVKQFVQALALKQFTSEHALGMIEETIYVCLNTENGQPAVVIHDLFSDPVLSKLDSRWSVEYQYLRCLNEALSSQNFSSFDLLAQSALEKGVAIPSSVFERAFEIFQKISSESRKPDVVTEFLFRLAEQKILFGYNADQEIQFAYQTTNGLSKWDQEIHNSNILIALAYLKRSKKFVE